MTSEIAALLAPGQLQVTWIYWCLLALVALDLYFLGKGLAAPTAAEPASGPWARRGPDPARMRRLAWLSLVLALAYGIALAFRAPVAFCLALTYLVPAVLRYLLQFPHVRTPKENGTVIGSVIGSGLQVVLMLAGIASINPQSVFPLRLTTHLLRALP
jgi:hypothetical protein